MEFDAADLILATVAWTAQRYWRAHEFFVRAGFEEKRLLPRQRLLRCRETVQRSLEPDHIRVQTGPGLR